jgi:hypothetical protein
LAEAAGEAAQHDEEHDDDDEGREDVVDGFVEEGGLPGEAGEEVGEGEG